MLSLEFSLYSILSAANSDNVISSFPICFTSFSCLFAVAKASNTMLNKSGKKWTSLSCSPVIILKETKKKKHLCEITEFCSGCVASDAQWERMTRVSSLSFANRHTDVLEFDSEY